MARPLWIVQILKSLFPYRRSFARLSRIPIIKQVMKRYLFDGDAMVYLPKDRIVVAEEIPGMSQLVMPSGIVHHFIESANHLWIMNHCICRQGDDCHDYPKDLGCLFMGDAVLQIHSKLGHLVTKETAHQHIEKAQKAGLVHLIGKNKMDTIWLGVGPSNQLLTVCNCCPCCCLFKILPDLPSDINQKVQKMPGVQVWVDDQCIGCGTCVNEAVCFVEAIQIIDQKAVISADCRGCGRCIEVCPQEAIHLHISDDQFLPNTIEFIDKKVQVT